MYLAHALLPPCGLRSSVLCQVPHDAGSKNKLFFANVLLFGSSGRKQEEGTGEWRLDFRKAFLRKLKSILSARSSVAA